MNGTTKLETKSYLVNDDAMNKDVDTYVKLPDGSEWAFRTYLDKESNEMVTMSFIRFSEGPDDPFDDTADEPPKEVVEAYQAEMSNIEELIRTRRSDEEFEKKGCTPMVCPQCGHDTWLPPVSVTHDSHEQSDIQSA